MNSWSVKPEQWKYLTSRQQKRMFKKGFRLGGRVLLALVIFSLIAEFVVETFPPA